MFDAFNHIHNQKIAPFSGLVIDSVKAYT